MNSELFYINSMQFIKYKADFLPKQEKSYNVPLYE